MKELHDSLAIILGNHPLSYYLAGFFFSALAILLSFYQDSTKRDISSPHTPVQFSWKFLICDNLKRAVAGLIVMFLLFRMFDLSNVFAMIGVGFFVGFGLDKAIEFLMEKTNLVNFLQPGRKKNEDETN